MKTFALIAFAAAAFAASAGENKYTLEQLQSAANYLSTRIEKPETKILACDPSPEAAKEWLGSSLHSLLDEKVQSEAARFKRNPAQLLKRAKDCHRQCTCGAFAAVLEVSEEEMAKNPVYKDLSTLLTKESKREDSLKCAKSFKAFCASALAKFLSAPPP